MSVVIEGGDKEIKGKKEVRGELKIEIRKGWKKYWRNKGDEGVKKKIRIEGDEKEKIELKENVRLEGEEEGGIG